jgi:arsenate reductase (glutaredoxin)
MVALSVEALYWLPYCSTCQKAEAWLKEQGLEIKSTTDMKATPLSMEQIKQLAAQVGGVEALFSKRSMKYRAWGLHEKTLSDEDMLGYMQQEYTFIKRPVVVLSNGKTVCGFSVKQYELALKG